MPDKKVWWQSWIGLVVGLLTICTALLGALTWQYDTFATDEEVKIGDKRACDKVVQLSEETLKGFEEVGKTNMQMQKSIRRFDLKDSHKQLLEQKYDLLKKLENDPNNQELKIDLDLCRSRIKMIEEELKELRLK